MSATTVNPRLVKSPLVRISYPNVFKPQEFEGGKKNYNLVMLIPKTEGVTDPRKDPKLRSMYNALKAAAVEKWDTSIPENIKIPIKSGDVAGENEDEPKAEYVGMWVIGCVSDNKPGIVGPDLHYLENESEFYAGCWAFVSLNTFAWKNQYNKCGCSFGLRNCQKVRDDDKLGGFVSAHDDFEPIDDPQPSDDGEDDDGTF